MNKPIDFEKEIEKYGYENCMYWEIMDKHAILMLVKDIAARVERETIERCERWRTTHWESGAKEMPLLYSLAPSDAAKEIK